jgi:predicted MFS family arabinose efflux permease
MAATTRLVQIVRRGMATGVVNAGGSFGQFIFAPVAQGITAAAGWVAALQSLALFTLLALPAAWVLRTRPSKTAPAATGAAPAVPREGARAALKRAFALPSYRWLSAGFFVCGFHVAFIATHLPGVVASCQLPPEVGAWSLAVIGLFNILGSLTIGWAIGYRGGRWRMKSLLSLIYAARALAVLVFVFAPKTSTTMLIFAAVIGFTYLSTVPPTAGLVARFFGPAHMAMLFGVVMLSHQLGGFLGAYLGGKSVEWTGSYDWMWWADIVLAVGAALAHLPIDEKKQPVPAVQPA